MVIAVAFEVRHGLANRYICQASVYQAFGNSYIAMLVLIDTLIFLE